MAALLISGCASLAPDETNGFDSALHDNTLADFRVAALHVPAASIDSAALPVLTSNRAPTPDDVVEAVYGTPAPDNVSISAQGPGSFTEPDAKEHLFLLSRGLPNASQPRTNARSMIAVFHADEHEPERFGLHTQFVPGRDYRAISAIADVNNDKHQDVLLSRFQYHMGVLTVSADLYTFANGKRQQLARFDDVYVDSCESGFGERLIVARQLTLNQALPDRSNTTLLETEATEPASSPRKLSVAGAPETVSINETSTIQVTTFTEECPVTSSD